MSYFARQFLKSRQKLCLETDKVSALGEGKFLFERFSRHILTFLSQIPWKNVVLRHIGSTHVPPNKFYACFYRAPILWITLLNFIEMDCSTNQPQILPALRHINHTGQEEKER